MSYFSERKGLKAAFVFAAMSLGVAGAAAYCHIEKNEPNPMAIVFASVFGLMSAGSYRGYRADIKAAKNSQDQSPKP